MEWSLNAPGLCPWERGRKLVSIRLFISRSEFTSNAVDEFLSKLNNFNGLSADTQIEISQKFTKSVTVDQVDSRRSV